MNSLIFGDFIFLKFLNIFPELGHTPVHGGHTPVHDGHTPVHGGQQGVHARVTSIVMYESTSQAGS